MEISLQGVIGKIFLPSILQLLCNDKKTGVLRVWQGEAEVKIYLHEGNIVYAVSSQKNHRLGYLLRKKGIVSSQELRTCLKTAQERKQALGKILVARGIITKKNLQTFMSEKIQLTLNSLLTWKTGQFEYLEKNLNLTGHIITPLHSLELIMEACRSADEKSKTAKKESINKKRSGQEPTRNKKAKKRKPKTITLVPTDEFDSLIKEK